jgi:hypothetical protein
VFSQSWVATRYYDAASSITYSSVTLPNGVSYRIALPIDSPTADGIVQIVAPNKYGWCGLAWGGRMTGNPLTVVWPSKAANGQKVVVSNRWATYDPSYPSTSCMDVLLSVADNSQRIFRRSRRLHRSIPHVPPK